MYAWQLKHLQAGDWCPAITAVPASLPTADDLMAALPADTVAVRVRLMYGERTGYCHFAVIRRGSALPTEGTTYEPEAAITHHAAPQRITRHWAKNMARVIRMTAELAADNHQQQWEVERVRCDIAMVVATMDKVERQLP